MWRINDSKLRDKERSISHGNTERQRILSRSSHCGYKTEEKGLGLHIGATSKLSIIRESQIAIGWNEEFCARHQWSSYVATAEERRRRANSWVLVQQPRETGPMNQREDYFEAKRIKDRLYEEAGEGKTTIHPPANK